MNKYIKIAIISLIVILIMLMICTVILINKPDENIPVSRVHTEEDDEVIIEHGTIQRVKSRDDFSMVDKCVKEYISYVYNKETDVICKLIDKTYMEQNGITEENVLSKILNFQENQKFTSRVMYYTNNMPLQTYYVYGLLQTYSDQTGSYDNGIDLYITVNVDLNKLIYSITPDLDFNIFDIQTEEKLKIKNNIKVQSLEIGENNVYNTIEYENVDDMTQIRRYMDDYISLSLSNVELAYNLTDPIYRQAKFEDINQYKTYIGDNKSRLESTYIAQYFKEGEEEEQKEYITYICVDNYGNTYTIKEYSIMDYHISLDSFTVKDDEYKDSYAKLENDKKVIQNINNFIEMINTKSYEQAYKLLDEQYRQSNFPTLEAYKQYINQIMFEYSKPESVRLTQEGIIYMCDVTIVDKVNQVTEARSLKIIIQLLEDANFVMSFNRE